jgi:hypothetical protein
MENDLVRYSRAGDVFHYRWAARRCLKMIHPKSLIKSISIEGSKEREKAGEYIIDVAEYVKSLEDGNETITYFQLKHSTQQLDSSFTLSKLKDTIEGFARRFSALVLKKNGSNSLVVVKFAVITNRPIDNKLKENIIAMGKGIPVNRQFHSTIEKYTKLKDRDLQDFCACLELVDGEGNYVLQRHELCQETSNFLAGDVQDPQIDTILALIQEKALPKSDGNIVREDILRRLGVTSERDLFPAPLELEKAKNFIKREQHEILLKSIIESSTNIIIHAGGGVGKSVFSCQLAESLPNGSLGFVYDCFGSGKYRNRSESRHRYRDALIQIINEIALHGLCELLIPRSTDLDDAILRAFLSRLKIASKALQEVVPNALLVILIDAADNSEMAAKEFSESCFANHLLREEIPEGCRLIFLCRTERINLLKPSSTVIQLELKSFSKTETLVHLREYFSDATSIDGSEFHRLTGGNPRVQANVLSLQKNNIYEVLDSLGPSGTTVDQQIAVQLESAISRVKDKLPPDHGQYIEAICLGLANLTPFIPIDVLAMAADVEISAVKSFVADLGRPLWITDNSVQFRDEPTETWFRERFSALIEQIESYVIRLKPLASKSPYIAQVLPSLLLQSEKYDELIALALSDDYLPQNNPIDERSVRVYRLQFAFKAALKKKRYYDAGKLAFRAGEEVAGDKRQIELLSKNVDLISPLQSPQRIQELAFRRQLHGNWDGSENIYSAALLSSIDEFKGEARSFLRSAHNWLSLYFKGRNQNSEETQHDKQLKDNDILEMAFTHFNIYGTQKLVDFILGWKPSETIFRIMLLFTRRLIDAGNFNAIDEISEIGCHNPYLIIAIAHELLAVGRFPLLAPMQYSLNLLINNQFIIPKLTSDQSEQEFTSAVISYAEAICAIGLIKDEALQVLNDHISQKSFRFVANDYKSEERHIFLRVVALKAIIAGDVEPELERLMPKELQAEKDKDRKRQDVSEFNQVVGGLLPWYLVRSRILMGSQENIEVAFRLANESSTKSLSMRYERQNDSLMFEIANVRFESLVLNKLSITDQPLDSKYGLSLSDLLKAVRSAYRLEHLSNIKNELEQSCYEMIASILDEEPEQKANYYISLARAVLPHSHADASEYFNCAIEAVSKFGDELVERWQAVVAMAKRSAEEEYSSAEVAYRFIRCAELVGESVCREKHWNRDEAINVCSRLHPSSAFTALSRWRDRDIGWFDHQISALAHEAVDSKSITPSVGWSLSVFSWDDGFDEFIVICIENESDQARRQYIFDSAVRDLRLRDAPESSLYKLKRLGDKFSLKNEDLQKTLDFHDKQCKTNNEEDHIQGNRNTFREEPLSVNWESIFDSLNIANITGLNTAISRFDSAPYPHDFNTFWQEVFSRVPENKASELLSAISTADNIDFCDAKAAIANFPCHYHKKISVKKQWNNFIQLIGERFAHELTNYYRRVYFFEETPLDKSTFSSLNQGIINGLSKSSNLVDAREFFGFAEIVSEFISPTEASNLLEFALTRFEKHIDSNYGDGSWDDWLLPPDNVVDSFAGFVWSMLGSPRSEIRWQATHCVHRLAEAGCEAEINYLIEWMNQDITNAFGSKMFPFYNLHARLYLFIALARVAVDNPKIIRQHHLVFSHHALEALPHVLIQKFASEIALSIEQAFPNTYSTDIVNRLQQVGISNMPFKEISSQQEYSTQTPFHTRNEIDLSLNLHFGWDFEHYWFDPLGDVFGIFANQIEDLARQTVIKEWKMEFENGNIYDPRNRLWNSNRTERETYHSHGEYPKTDNYSFYISYHAMFSVAAKLLSEMPIVHSCNWRDNEWIDWLQRHTLTYSNGLWLADLRVLCPMQRSSWIQKRKTESWQHEKIPDSFDFLDGLLTTYNAETWLCVGGSWSDNDKQYEEDLDITSSLVLKESSQSLLNALSTCSDSGKFKLPDYQEERMEFNLSPFELHGWIYRKSKDKSLDDSDPHADNIDYPPYEIGKSIIDKFDLYSDSKRLKWFMPGEKESLVCELWSSPKKEDYESQPNSGVRINASLNFLKMLCSELDRDLIIEVRIKRRLLNYNRGKNDTEYSPPISKIYILSADGQLRDTEAYYLLR